MKIYQSTTIQAVQTIDEVTYKSYRDDIESYELWRNGRTSYQTSEIPDYLRHVSNEMRGKVEQYEFKHGKPPVKYFAYWSKRFVSETSYQLWLTTFTGDILAKVSTNNEYHDNFGGTRVNFNCLALNGLWYYGTYYKSSGDYCRIKLLKRSPTTNKPQ